MLQYKMFQVGNLEGFDTVILWQEPAASIFAST